MKALLVLGIRLLGEENNTFVRYVPAPRGVTVFPHSIYVVFGWRKWNEMSKYKRKYKR